MTDTIRYDMASGNRLRLVNLRSDGNGLYEDLDDGSFVVCPPNKTDEYPRGRTEFKPIEIIHDRKIISDINNLSQMPATAKFMQAWGRVHRVANKSVA